MAGMKEKIFKFTCISLTVINIHAAIIARTHTLGRVKKDDVKIKITTTTYLTVFYLEICIKYATDCYN
jgi:hypothetical protein